MNTVLLCLILGLVAGIISGMIGIGGGLVILPALMLFLGFSQHLAQGTTLALLALPVDLLAAWTYYKQGDVDIKVAAILCLGFIFGGWFGAKIGLSLPNEIFNKVFAFLLLISAARILFLSHPESL
ncbi:MULTISPECIES: sulfite exporter TauE/SafE family protein [Nostoc]|uniref:Probable membrane transporter protein n=1 Tax=Nostoc paludosum FACHB-159 TaxID=2692908 RepID=A0ABR8KDZ4_9NOSO|nr:MULTISPECIES: sulfite exporter TauE/SafE family protein [Nostoc]MBD2681301.1 sulfite exporter TauE/SafE family protein [Nostoc sp. FACHB-857]MBD2737780.1 sulfite exporter TauE/SafE family protein [Nostoc paludosum FACHB-159]